MIEDAKPWPDYLPEFGREDLIAIGVIALNYGELESGGAVEISVLVIFRLGATMELGRSGRTMIDRC
jgi:hypothetical protein